ncbi:MAG: 6-carboxytetrahydropterin synthase [Candidatus Krumholzibacteria bacterium]|nr:6-carboxytetrahydropterin synthase [Candidatus Krumholzibacteria bacterium]
MSPRRGDTAIFNISTEIRFSASHALLGYEGDCARVHGHNWVVRVYYDFDGVDKQGFTIDYRQLRLKLKELIICRFDHRHLNDVPPFDSINPTSENIAAEIFRLCHEHMQVKNGVLTEIELWETSADMVRYREKR